MNYERNDSKLDELTPGFQAAGALNIFQKRAQDFRDLQQKALQSGDITAAQKALAALSKDLPVTPQAMGATSNSSSQNGPLSKDIQILKSTLDSGDLLGRAERVCHLEAGYARRSSRASRTPSS